jgi:hypothetical protein
MFWKRIVLTIFVLQMIFAKSIIGSAETPTYAERLGWPVGTKVVILHADHMDCVSYCTSMLTQCTFAVAYFPRRYLRSVLSI